MIYNYTKEVKLDLLESEIKASSITIALHNISLQGTDLNIEFKAAISSNEKTELDSIVNDHDKNAVFNTDPQNVKIDNTVMNYPFGDKQIGGKSLFMRVTGLEPQDIASNSNYVFTYTIPYTHCKITCAEIVEGVTHQADLEVHHPIAGLLNRFGKDVNMGSVYKRESYYDADLFSGLEVKVRVTNISSTTKKFGVNLILHEVKE